MKDEMRTTSTRWRVARLGFALVWLACTACGAAHADDPIDSLLECSPVIATPRLVRTLPDRLPGLWIEVLGRPEADLRCQAALAIGRAHERGMRGLPVTVPALTQVLADEAQHPSVPLAAARALVTLDAKDAAPALFTLASTGDDDLREVIEPALSRWRYGPAQEAWLNRLNQPDLRGRAAIRVIQALAAAHDGRAVPRLRELVLSAETPPGVRLECAKALGSLRTSGGESDADRLAVDTSARGVVGRLAGVLLLRRHAGAEAAQRLLTFARDAEPSVATVALGRLVEIDAALVEPVLATALASPDATVRALGVDVLFRRPSEEHVRLLGDRLADVHPDVRAQARRALRERAAQFRAAVNREGDRALAGPDWRGREQAAVLFAQVDHQPAAGRLVAALDDDRPEVAIAAAWALRVLAVPDTYPKVLDHFKQHTRPAVPLEWRDRQLCHLAQLLGQARYRAADAALRAVVPPQSPPGVLTRASACWALGLLHEGKPVPEVAAALAGRLAAVKPFDVELGLVRRMSAVSLGRMKATDNLPTLREFYTDAKPSFNSVNNACGWAIEQVTGEKMPPPGVIELTQRDMFLAPLN